jgi:hypothetical protein
MKANKELLIIFLLAFCLFPACNTVEKEMLVTTGSISKITTNSAEAIGQIIDIGENANQHGHCSSAAPNVSITSTRTQLGKPSGFGSFTSQLTNLDPGTKYYVKAYLSNGITTVYGDEVNFTTTSASSCGNISSDGGASVTARGVCWSISASPTTVNSKTTEASAGWYWQFNRQQGYKHDGSNRIPGTAWTTSISENSNWIAANDPSTILLGAGWRIPTQTEWTNADANGGWNDPANAFSSTLKLHTNGALSSGSGYLTNRGSGGSYWSSTQENNTNSIYLGFSIGACGITSNSKA